MSRLPPLSTRTYTFFPYTTLCRSNDPGDPVDQNNMASRWRPNGPARHVLGLRLDGDDIFHESGEPLDLPGIEQLLARSIDQQGLAEQGAVARDRKSTPLNSSHSCASRMQSSA